MFYAGNKLIKLNIYLMKFSTQEEFKFSVLATLTKCSWGGLCEIADLGIGAGSTNEVSSLESCIELGNGFLGKGKFEEGEGVGFTKALLVYTEKLIMGPDLRLRLPVGDLESDAAALCWSSCLNISEVLRRNFVSEILHVHLTILEQHIELSFVIIWISLNHSE